MPGLYVVISRAPGTIITELIYNSDHQNHVDGRSAEEMAGYGVSGSQFQLTEDPFPGSVESLPASLAGEITRLRFVIAQIISELSGGASVNWYDTMASPGLPFIGARVQRPTSITIPDAFGTVISFSGGSADFNSTVPALVWDDMGQPTRFTAPVAGRYMAFVSVTWTANSTGRRQLAIGVNNVFGNNPQLSNLAPSGVSQAQALTGLLDLAANDYVQFSAFQNSGGNLNLVLDGARSIVGGLVFLGS